MVVYIFQSFRHFSTSLFGLFYIPANMQPFSHLFIIFQSWTSTDLHKTTDAGFSPTITAQTFALIWKSSFSCIYNCINGGNQISSQVVTLWSFKGVRYIALYHKPSGTMLPLQYHSVLAPFFLKDPQMLCNRQAKFRICLLLFRKQARVIRNYFLYLDWLWVSTHLTIEIIYHWTRIVWIFI